MLNNKIKKSIKMILRIFGYRIIKLPKIDIPQPKAFYDSQDEFNALHEQIRQYTLLSKNRLFMLYQLLKYSHNLEGDVAEVGVYKGGTAKLMAKTVPCKNVYLFDTFSGMPAMSTEIDIHKVKDFSDVSPRSVKSLLKDCPNVTFCEGVFPDTASLIKDKKFSLVHIDVDFYKSIKYCLGFFYGRMVRGGVIVIDDYESPACPGVKKAVCEFLADKKEYPIITTEVQCAIIKL